MRHVRTCCRVVLVVVAPDPWSSHLRLILLLRLLHHLQVLPAQRVCPLVQLGAFRTVKHLLVCTSVVRTLLIFL